MSDSKTTDPGVFRDFVQELFDLFDGIKIDLATGKVEKGEGKKTEKARPERKDTDVKPPTKSRFTEDGDSEACCANRKVKVCPTESGGVYNPTQASVDERLGNLGEIVGTMYDDVKDFRERLLVEEATSDADAVVLAELRKDFTSLEGDVAYVNKEIENIYKEIASLRDAVKDLKDNRGTNQQTPWKSPIDEAWTQTTIAHNRSTVVKYDPIFDSLVFWGGLRRGI